MTSQSLSHPPGGGDASVDELVRVIGSLVGLVKNPKSALTRRLLKLRGRYLRDAKGRPFVFGMRWVMPRGKWPIEFSPAADAMDKAR